jgi:hypothetical protein
MAKYLRLSSCIGKPFLIYDFALSLYLRKNFFSNSVLGIYHGGPNNLSLSQLLCEEIHFHVIIMSCGLGQTSLYSVYHKSQHRWLNAMYMHNRSHGYNLRSTPPPPHCPPPPLPPPLPPNGQTDFIAQCTE